MNRESTLLFVRSVVESSQQLSDIQLGGNYDNEKPYCPNDFQL